MLLIMHAEGQDGGSKVANLSSTLIICCASSAQRNFSPFKRVEQRHRRTDGQLRESKSGQNHAEALYDVRAKQQFHMPNYF